MKTLQYNSWNSTLNKLDITTTGNKLEFVDLVVAVSLTTYQSCAVPSYSLIVSSAILAIPRNPVLELDRATYIPRLDWICLYLYFTCIHHVI